MHGGVEGWYWVLTTHFTNMIFLQEASESGVTQISELLA